MDRTEKIILSEVTQTQRQLLYEDLIATIFLVFNMDHMWEARKPDTDRQEGDAFSEADAGELKVERGNWVQKCSSTQ